MIKVTIDPQDLIPLYRFYFTSSHEGKSEHPTHNRMFEQLDKEIRKQYGIAYNNYVTTLRNEVKKLRDEAIKNRQ